jgi:hypothetical protein
MDESKGKHVLPRFWIVVFQVKKFHHKDKGNIYAIHPRDYHHENLRSLYYNEYREILPLYELHM